MQRASTVVGSSSPVSLAACIAADRMVSGEVNPTTPVPRPPVRREPASLLRPCLRPGRRGIPDAATGSLRVPSCPEQKGHSDILSAWL